METDLHHVTVSVTATSHTNTSRTATMVSRGNPTRMEDHRPHAATFHHETTGCCASARAHGLKPPHPVSFNNQEGHWRHQRLW